MQTLTGAEIQSTSRNVTLGGHYIQQIVDQGLAWLFNKMPLKATEEYIVRAFELLRVV